MTTSAPVKKEYDIPIIKPMRISEEPKRLNPGILAPIIVSPIKVPVPERVLR